MSEYQRTGKNVKKFGNEKFIIGVFTWVLNFTNALWEKTVPQCTR